MWPNIQRGAISQLLAIQPVSTFNQEAKVSKDINDCSGYHFALLMRVFDQNYFVGQAFPFWILL